MTKFNELLWVFTQLPDNYIVLDTETTGLPDENGLPDIVSLGITVVRKREIRESVEFKVRPEKPITLEAQRIHGISDQEAKKFGSFPAQWNEIATYINDQLIIIHNASFDWPILVSAVNRYGLTKPRTLGVFCSQKAAMCWALANQFECSERGPSLDELTRRLRTDEIRARFGGTHHAKGDSQQAAHVVQAMISVAFQ